jgi:hypothetical protein
MTGFCFPRALALLRTPVPARPAAGRRRRDALFVLTALWAAAERWAGVRRDAAEVAWRDIAAGDAALLGSRFKAFDTAWATRGRWWGLRLP